MPVPVENDIGRIGRSSDRNPLVLGRIFRPGLGIPLVYHNIRFQTVVVRLIRIILYALYHKRKFFGSMNLLERTIHVEECLCRLDRPRDGFTEGLPGGEHQNQENQR